MNGSNEEFVSKEIHDEVLDENSALRKELVKAKLDAERVRLFHESKERDLRVMKSIVRLLDVRPSGKPFFIPPKRREELESYVSQIMMKWLDDEPVYGDEI